MTDLYRLEHRERDEDPWDVLVGNLEVGEAQSAATTQRERGLKARIVLQYPDEVYCPICGGCGWVTRPGCCGRPLRSGECCGEAIPMQEPCPAGCRR